MATAKCPSCDGDGEYNNWDPMGGTWHTCGACNGAGVITFLTPQERAEKAVDEAFEKRDA